MTLNFKFVLCPRFSARLAVLVALPLLTADDLFLVAKGFLAQYFE
jgi:hypothetical protein